MAEGIAERVELTVEGAAECLREAIYPLLRPGREQASCVIRPSVTFVGIDLRIGERLYSVLLSRIQNAIDRGNLDVVAKGLLHQMRMRPVVRGSGPPLATDLVYDYQQVLREVVWEQIETLRGVVAPGEFTRLWARCIKQLRDAIPEAVNHEWDLGTDPSCAELVVLRRALQSEIRKGFKYRYLDTDIQTWAQRKAVKRPARKTKERREMKSPSGGDDAPDGAGS